MPLRVLLADSNIAAQTMGTKILSAAGHQVVAVSNGLAAVQRILDLQLDLVLLDVHLPGRSGIEICQIIKAMPDPKQMSVFLTAGRMEPFGAEQGVAAKADGLILKPFEASCLIPVVEKIAQRLCPPDTSCLVVRSMRTGAQSCNELTPQSPPCMARPESTNPERQAEPEPQPLSQAGARFAPRSESDRVLDSSGTVPRQSSSTQAQEGEEVCDVCGFVNQEYAFACRQCDVPLPSSVRGGLTSPRFKTSLRQSR